MRVVTCLYGRGVRSVGMCNCRVAGLCDGRLLERCGCVLVTMMRSLGERGSGMVEGWGSLVAGRHACSQASSLSYVVCCAVDG